MFACGKNYETLFYTEKDAEVGIVKIAKKVVKDYEKITSLNAEVLTCSSMEEMKGKSIVFFANSKESNILAEMEKKSLIDLSQVKNKWEVFGQFVLNNPWPGAEQVLVIAGSDKRGTIYGMFDLSEKMGVSPLCYIADSVIPKKDNMELELPNMYISKEPSVQYRGFFINDEWPCFGNWTFGHFGGFTAEMYDHVFELLLRLKGNYLWPAMWTSSFALDGPGEASYILADEYGVVIGNSHHEPCLRASEEWDLVRGEDSIYGNAWNFQVNPDGLKKYWEDGLARSARLESMVTIGMRGERDSKVMGDEATLKDNIDLLKDIIHCQKELIAKEEVKNGKNLPKLLALYKEVEPYFYGDETTEGLCEWKELEDVILMLCEDNHGYMRTLPDEKMRKHPGGYGMYYHVDYHGGPVSYEWVNSTPLNVIWEQMCKAYDTGVNKVWILNVGDLKFNEFPLTFFLNLAYDFEKYGTKNPGKEKEYTRNTLAKHLGEKLSAKQLDTAEEIFSESIRLAALRRPEALTPSVYHPFHYGEADRIALRAEGLLEKAESFALELKGLGEDVWEAWHSLCGHSSVGIANHILLNIYAAKNEAYAKQGRKEANTYGEMYKACLEKDRSLAKAMKEFKAGKWDGMERAAHIGFTKWNEDGCKYPVRSYVEPFDRPRMLVTYSESERVYDKVYGSPMRIKVDDFYFEGNKESKVIVSNSGLGDVKFKVNMPDCTWLSVSQTEGVAETSAELIFTCDREKLTAEEEKAIASITDGDTTVEVEFQVKKWPENLKEGTFLPGKGGIVMDAQHYVSANEASGSKAVVLDDYGIVGSAVKFYPDDALYERGAEPSLTYKFYAPSEQNAKLTLWFAPCNPMTRSGRMEYGIKVNEEEIIYKNIVPEGYMAGENSDRFWCTGALNRRHVSTMDIPVKNGENELTISFRDAGIVLERIFVNADEKLGYNSYLGPKESVRR